MEGHNRQVCFMGKADAAIETVKQIIRAHFGCDADEIGKIRNITNNSVYFFTIAGNGGKDNDTYKTGDIVSRRCFRSAQGLIRDEACTERPEPFCPIRLCTA